MGGTAISGVLISSLRMISKKVGGDSFEGLRNSSLVYFCIAAFTCLLGVAGYLIVLPRVHADKHTAYQRVSTGEEDGYEGGHL